MAALRWVLHETDGIVLTSESLVRLGGQVPLWDFALNSVGSLPLGSMLFGADRDLLQLNHTAKRILESQTVVRIEGNQLVFVRYSDSSAFKKLFHDVLKDPVSCAMAVKRDDGPPLTLLLTGMCSEQSGNLRCVVVLLGDANVRFTASAASLKAFFDFTPAETRLAMLLLQGCTLKQASDSMRVTAQTVRVHLKSVFRKTGTNRQSQLIYVLLSSPAGAHLTRGEARRASA